MRMAENISDWKRTVLYGEFGQCLTAMRVMCVLNRGGVSVILKDIKEHYSSVPIPTKQKLEKHGSAAIGFLQGNRIWNKEKCCKGARQFLFA